MTTLDEREAARLGVALPGASAYTEATRTFNLAAPVAPAAAVTARTWTTSSRPWRTRAPTA